MTEKIICKKCGFLLYWGEAIKERLFFRLSEEIVLHRYGDKCPTCGSPLSKEDVDIIIEN